VNLWIETLSQGTLCRNDPTPFSRQIRS
jgi:hypothetical protein